MINNDAWQYSSIQSCHKTFLGANFNAGLDDQCCHRKRFCNCGQTVLKAASNNFDFLRQMQEKMTKKSHARVYRRNNNLASTSGSNQGAIDNRIEQAMDLVKSHLMNAVRSEVEDLKEKIIKLEDTISTLQSENEILRAHASPETISQLAQLQQQQQQQLQQQQVTAAIGSQQNCSNKNSASTAPATATASLAPSGLTMAGVGTPAPLASSAINPSTNMNK